MLFSDLVTVVFPALDKFFTFLSTMAVLPYYKVCEFAFSDTLSGFVIRATGFTGEVFTWYPPNAGGPLSIVFQGAFQALGTMFNVNNVPFALALLIIFAGLFLFTLAIRFIVSCFNRAP